MIPFIAGTQIKHTAFKCQENTHTSNNLLYAYVKCTVLLLASCTTRQGKVSFQYS